MKTGSKNVHLGQFRFILIIILKQQQHTVPFAYILSNYCCVLLLSLYNIAEKKRIDTAAQVR
jgi:hypothetical protein